MGRYSREPAAVPPRAALQYSEKQAEQHGSGREQERENGEETDVTEPQQLGSNGCRQHSVNNARK